MSMPGGFEWLIIIAIVLSIIIGLPIFFYKRGKSRGILEEKARKADLAEGLK